MPLDHVELPCLGYVMPSYVMLNFCMAKHLFFGLESAEINTLKVATSLYQISFPLIGI